MASVNEITVPQLGRLIGLPDCPPIVDVCLEEDFALDPVVIPTALRHDFRDLDGLAARLAGLNPVVVCQKGKKLSQGVTAWLRSAGIAAEYLQGGMVAWRAAGQPCVAAARLPSAALWVTRHRPKIDRIACPWMVRRFVDRQARVLYVAPSEVAAVAERFGATPFDIPGAPLGHTGDGCSFDALLDHFELRTEPLDRMARVIRAADLDRHADSPQAAGLLALSVGLSRQYRDDAQQLEAGLALYDALYRWARDGFAEGHSE